MRTSAAWPGLRAVSWVSLKLASTQGLVSTTVIRGWPGCTWRPGSAWREPIRPALGAVMRV